MKIEKETLKEKWLIFLVLGVIILLNKEEDEIEQIKYPKGHKYPRRKK